MTTSYHTSIDIDAEARNRLNVLLNSQLADTFDLFSQTKQAHWNVKGMHFIQLHELFDKLAEDLEEHTDTIAERVTALGGTAQGTTRMAAGASRLPEIPLELGGGQTTVKLLVERYAKLGQSTRRAIDEADKLGDADTADLFTAVSRDLDKALWFLEAHLQD
jgi:starvation-inducible DNA-binding protein